MVNKRRDAVLLTSSTKQNKGARFSWEPVEHVVQTSQVLSREDSRLCKGHRKHSLGNTSDLQQIPGAKPNKSFELSSQQRAENQLHLCALLAGTSSSPFVGTDNYLFLFF